MVKSVLIYSLVFTYSFFLYNLYLEKKYISGKFYKIKNFIFLSTAIAPLVILAGIRYEVGTDYFTYIKYYETIVINLENNIFSYSYIEPFWVFLNIIVKFIFNTPIALMFVSSFIFMYILAKSIELFDDKFSKNLSFIIGCLLLYNVHLNGIRQLIAVVIIFNSIRFIFEKKFIKFYIAVFIAFLFHNTAIIAIFIPLLLFFVGKDKKSKINFVYYAIILTSFFWIPVILKILKKLIEILNIGERYLKYLNSTGNFNFNFLLYIIPVIIIYMICKLILKKENRNNYFFKEEFLFRLFLMQIPFQIMGMYVNSLDRISLYFSTSQILLLPFIIEKINNKKIKKIKKIIKIVIILWYVFYYIVMFILMKGNGTYPYSSIFIVS